MVELVDTPDLGSGAERRVSSSLIRRTHPPPSGMGLGLDIKELRLGNKDFKLGYEASGTSPFGHSFYHSFIVRRGLHGGG